MFLSGITCQCHSKLPTIMHTHSCLLFKQITFWHKLLLRSRHSKVSLGTSTEAGVIEAIAPTGYSLGQRYASILQVFSTKIKIIEYN